MQFEHNSKEMNIWNNDFGCEAGHSRSTIAWRGLQPTQDPPAGRSWGAPLHRYTAPLPGQWADRPTGGCCTETVTARNNTARTIRNESAYPQVDLKSFKGSLPIEEIFNVFLS